jgi:hemoglobin-like flavoprotein
MTPHQLHLVEKSFKAFIPVAYRTSGEFYETLFRASPHLRGMFPADMIEQRKKLVETLSYVVNGMRFPELTLPVVRKLGKRHVGFKVRPEHYTLVASALLDAMEREIGPAFTPR